MKEKKNYLIQKDILLLDAIKILENNYKKILIVVDSKNKLIGTISDGDVRRRLIRQGDINISCGELANKNCIFSEVINNNGNEIIALARQKRVTLIPVVDENREVIDLIEVTKPSKAIKNSVVIMAGGLGKRLRPLTNNIPKPLLKVGDKPIIRRITDKFSNEGFSQFIISIGYLSDKFLDYYKNVDKTISPVFIHEKKPLGTAGPLSELKNIEQVYYPLVVTNGDVIFEDNISSILENFQEQNIDGLMLCREEHNLIPYGVVESDLDSNFINIKEKPKYNYLVNGGIYILSKKILDLIKEGENLDMPELFMRAKSKDYIVKIFTLKEYWIDVGRVDNLEMANRKFN